MVDGWDMGHMFPFGHYVTSLGPVGEVKAQQEATGSLTRTKVQPWVAPLYAEPSWW